MEKNIPVEDIKDGMVLVHPVENENGMVLCGAGTVLSTKHIARFQNRGVMTVSIEAEVGISPEEIEKSIADAEKRFSGIAEDDSFEGKLKKAVLSYLREKKDELVNE